MWRGCSIGLLVVALIACGTSNDAAPDAAVAPGVDATSAGCGAAFVCPAAAAGKVTVCGQLTSLRDSLPIRTEGASGQLCDEATTDELACTIDVTPYDAIQYANDPQNPTALAAQIEVDDCGRFRVQDAALPGTGFFALAFGNRSTTSTETWIETAMILPVASSQRESDVHAYVLDADTDEMWTASAGDPFGGQTFGERGAHLAMFQGTAGVVVTVDDVPVSDAYYFSDADPHNRTTIDTALTETGPNGASLVTDSFVGTHSGQGGEPLGCTWDDFLAATISGVVSFSQVRLVDIATGEPCP